MDLFIVDALTINQASRAELDIVLNILLEAQAWLRANHIDQWTLPFTAEWVATCLERGEFFSAEIDQTIVAVVRLTESDLSVWADPGSDAIYIHSLAVRRGWQGLGIGRKMLDWVKAYAVRNQRRYLRLDCMADNIPLCRYYEKAGFVARQVKLLPTGQTTYRAQCFEMKLAA